MIETKIVFLAVLFGLTFSILTRHGGLLQGYRHPYCLSTYLSIILCNVYNEGDWSILLSVPVTLVLTYILNENLIH